MSYPQQPSLRIQQGQAQSLKQSQRLMMSPQMQQAIHLLQVPILELSAMIEAEMEKNPVLEYASEEEMGDRFLEQETGEFRQEVEESSREEMDFDEQSFEVMRRLDEEFRDHFAESGNFYNQTQRSAEEEKLKTFMESSIQSESTLFEHLMQQARDTFEDPQDLAAAEAIIGNLDESGFLSTPLLEIALWEDIEDLRLQTVLQEIQSFDPVGVATANPKESLLVQLRVQGKKNSLAYRIIEEHYDDLLHNRIPVITKQLSCSAEEVERIVAQELSLLDLRPGMNHNSTTAHYVTADVYIEQEERGFSITVNEESLPSLRLNGKYLRMLEDPQIPEETKEYIKQKIASSKWFMKNIHQRNDTLTRIAERLVEAQKEFFTNPQGKLNPLTMKSIAEELELHESTVARAVSNKYVSCSRGLIPLRSFFTNSYTTDSGDNVSSQTVRDVLLTIIEKEDKRKPLSDEAISSEMKRKGIQCARRTVAKYRREFNIGNASQRRSYSS